MQDTYSYGILRIAPFDMLLNNFGAHKFRGAINLQNWCLKVLFNNDIFCTELARLGTEYPYNTFETAHHNLVLRWVTIVNIADAN